MATQSELEYRIVNDSEATDRHVNIRYPIEDYRQIRRAADADNRKVGAWVRLVSVAAANAQPSEGAFENPQPAAPLEIPVDHTKVDPSKLLTEEELEQSKTAHERMVAPAAKQRANREVTPILKKDKK